MSLRSGSRGLSLMEMLVALALLGLVAGGLGSATTLMLRARERVAQQEAVAPAFAARALLRRWLAQAEPLGRDAPAWAGFEGGPDGFTFATLATGAFASDAAFLLLKVDIGPDSLMMTVAAHDATGAEIEPSLRRDLARGGAYAVAFLDPRFMPPQWVDTWSTEAGVLPRLIRLSSNGPSEPDWPPFVVRPLLSR